MKTARTLWIALAALAVMAFGTAPARANIGTMGPAFPGATAPTGEKPQSKLWFNDGTWWAVMFSSSTRDFEIFKRVDATWTSTGTKVDLRNNTWADAKWDGRYLHVVSHGPAPLNPTANDPVNNVRYSRYSYDPVAREYIRDISEAPLTSYGVKAAVIDEDSTGRLWVTFTHALKVLVTTSANGTSWGSPFAVPGIHNLPQDEISSVVHYDNRIGVMSSNEKDGAYYFSTHDDGQAPNKGWRNTVASKGPEMADDHMNVKALDGDPAGRVFAAVKTSLDRQNDPLLMLLVMNPKGQWQRYTLWNHGTLQPTRTQVVIDRGRREIYAFAAAPCCAGGIVYMKKASLDHPVFDPASLGTPVLDGDGHKINNVTTTKQPVDASTDLIALASADNTRQYWTARLPLSGPDLTPPETVITEGPAGETSETSATIAFDASEEGAGFTCTLDGLPYTPCTSPVSLNGLAPGEHSFTVAATDFAGNTDPSAATRTWTVSAAGPLFADDFESGDLSRWTTVATGPEGAAGVQQDSVAGGAFAARLSATATVGSFAYVRRSFSPAPTTLTAAATLRIDGEGAPGGNVPLVRLFDPAGHRLVSLYRPNGSTTVYASFGGTFVPTAARLPTGTFRRFAVAVTTAGDGAGTLVVSVDGIEVYRTASASLGLAGVGTVQFGNDTKAQPFSVALDDVEVR